MNDDDPRRMFMPLIPKDGHTKAVMSEMRDFLRQKAEDEIDPIERQKFECIAELFSGALMTSALAEEHGGLEPKLSWLDRNAHKIGFVLLVVSILLFVLYIVSITLTLT